MTKKAKYTIILLGAGGAGGVGVARQKSSLSVKISF